MTCSDALDLPAISLTTIPPTGNLVLLPSTLAKAIAASILLNSFLALSALSGVTV